MHRSYQPITPASNKLLKQRWDDTYFEEHRRKVATSKAVVDNKPPRTYMHLHLKLKKLQLEEERLATIERDNRILLEKMSQIMRTKGRVDNWNDYSVKSLNRTKRQQELLRVTHENQAILKRVLAQKPVYDNSKWEDHWLEKEGYMDSISKYPKEWYKKSATKKKTKERRGEGKQDSESSKKSSKKDRMSEGRRSPSPSHENQSGSSSVREEPENDHGSKRGSKRDSMSPKERKRSPVEEKDGRSPSPKEIANVVEVKEKDEVERNEITNEEAAKKQDEKPVNLDRQPDEKQEKQSEKPEKQDEKPEKRDGKPEKQDEKPEKQDEKPEKQDEKPEKPDGKPEKQDEKPAEPDVELDEKPVTGNDVPEDDIEDITENVVS